MKKAHILMLLLLTAFTLFFALATGFSLMYRLLYFFFLLILIGALWASLGLRRVTLSVQRNPQKAQVGDTFTTSVTIHNPTPLPKLWLEVEDRSDLPGDVTGGVVTLRPFATSTWKWQRPIVKRGVYTLGPVEITSSDLFGQFHLKKEFGEQEQLIVYPAPAELPSFRITHAEYTGDESLFQRSLQMTTNAFTIRDYMHGDSFNRIHWPSTARVGHLMVKEFEVGTGSQIWLMLDLHKDVQAGSEVENTEEYMVTIATSIAKKYLAEGWSVGLMAQGDKRYYAPAAQGKGNMDPLLHLLAMMRAEGHTPLERTLAEEASLMGPLSTAIIITSSSNPIWLQSIENLLKRRIRVVTVGIHAASFGGTGDPTPILVRLRSRGIPTYLVNQGEPLAQALDYHSVISDSNARFARGRIAAS